MMRLLLLAGDCPDAAGRAKVREEGRRVERAGTLAGSGVRPVGGCHLRLWHLYLQGKREAKAGKVAQTGGANRPHPATDVHIHNDSSVKLRMLSMGLRPGKDL